MSSMWKRRMSCPEGGEDVKLEEALSFEVLFTTPTPKRSSLRKKKHNHNDGERSYLKKVASEASFASAELEMDNEGSSLEVQLVVLQEQLVAAIIENQNLAEQVRLMRHNGSVENLAVLLAREKDKNRLLKERLHDKENDEDKRSREKSLPPEEKSPRSRSRGRFGWRRRGLEKCKSLDQSEFLANISLDDDDEQSRDYQSREGDALKNDLSNLENRIDRTENTETRSLDTSDEKPSMFRRFEGWISSRMLDFFKEFSEVQEETPVQLDNEGDPLTVKKLKDNVIRFSAIMKPLSNFTSLSGSLFKWESPPATLIVFIIYMGSVLYGYFLSLIFLFAIWCLTRNYMRRRGWTISLFKPTTSRQISDTLDSANETKLGDRFAVVLQVARRVQNILGTVSDGSEKLKNLVLWEHGATGKFYLLLWVLLVTSLFVRTYHLFTLLFVYLGIKFFIVDYIFFRFPRIRKKYSSTTRLWDTLPTDADLENRNEKNGIYQADVDAFLELFNLPPAEVPLTGWQNGKRCTLVNRDKSITSAFRNGRLYLTNSYLCFERSKTNREKNIVLCISDVVSLEKANSYPWIPGGGMAIEVFVTSGKVYFFGGIMNRDEVFDAIMDACRRGNSNGKKKEKEKEKEREEKVDDENKENKEETNKTNSDDSEDSNKLPPIVGSLSKTIEQISYENQMEKLDLID